MDQTQQGVARGMALALLTALAVFGLCAALGSRAWPGGADTASRLALAAWSLLPVAAMLLVCIARLAKHRFFTPEDIDGSALTAGTDRARLLQALLQNTLEQACLAVPVYLAAAILVPAFLLALVPAAGLMFLAGRLLFFAGYASGAPARAYGFALTFYPTALLVGMLAVLGLMEIAA